MVSVSLNKIFVFLEITKSVNSVYFEQCLIIHRADTAEAWGPTKSRGPPISRGPCNLLRGGGMSRAPKKLETNTRP